MCTVHGYKCNQLPVELRPITHHSFLLSSPQKLSSVSLMARLYSPQQSLPFLPDNLTVAQFMLDYQHEIQPPRQNEPCLIDDMTGIQIRREEVRIRSPVAQEKSIRPL